MSEFILCDRVFNEHALRTQCGLNINDLLDDRCKPPKRVDPDTPYLVNGTGDRSDKHIQTILARPQARQIREFSNLYGADNVQAMSELFGKVREKMASDEGTAGMGASTSVYANRMEGFIKSVNVYQRALMDYHAAKKTKSLAAVSARQNAVTAYQKMNASFGAELGQIKNSAGTRGTPLTSLNRGLNIARDSRKITRLNLTSAAEASRLVGFTRYAKHLGNGLTMIDVGTRIGNVKLANDSGGDPYRELYIESSSFAASAITGEVGAYTGALAIGFLVALTPAGWVGVILVVGGAAVIGGTTYVSVSLNDAQKRNAGAQYDWIMAKLTR